METSYLIVILIVGFVIVFQFGLVYTARKNQGQDITEVLNHFELPSQGRLLLFFTSAQCRPCRSMYPIIDSLQRDASNVVKIELNEHMRFASQLNVRATPTIMIIQNGLIEKVLLGSQSEAKLRKLMHML